LNHTPAGGSQTNWPRGRSHALAGPCRGAARKDSAPAVGRQAGDAGRAAKKGD